MDKWENMYRSYINISDWTPVFQQERCVEGIKQSGDASQALRIMTQSTLYKKYFTQDNTTYVGVGNRRRGKPNKETVNSSFSDFIGKNQKFRRKATHRQFIKNADAEYKSVSKYDKGQPTLDEAAWQLSKEWTIRHFGPGKMAGSVIVSREMAQQEMDKTTSPGWPHNLKHKNKTTLFADKKHSCIVDDYWCMIGRIQEEQEWVPIWQCSEKTELRLIEKLEENKVRTFTCAPVEHSVALNRMCLDMNNKFYNTNNQTWSFVGGNKFDSGFHRLWQRLQVHPNAFELDESAYDSSLFLRAMGDMVDIRYEFLSEDFKTHENRNRLENLYQSIIHSVIIMQNGEMFQKHTGNPSGSANTIVDNTIILFRLCAYAWIVLTREHMKKQRAFIQQTVNNSDVTKRTHDEVVEDYGYGGLMENVSAALNGDDNTFTVSDKMVHIFNADTIAKVWSSIGITTNTPNNKFGQKVEDVSFLSQSFTLHRGLYLPTPSTGKVYSSLLYGTDHDDPRWHLLRACAIRIDSWANEDMRSIIKAYIEFLWKENKVEFAQDVTLKFGQATVNMVDIMAMYRTDDWIFRLYSSHEASLFDDKFTKESLAILTEVAQTEEFSSKQISFTTKQSLNNIINMSTRRPNIGPLRPNGKFKKGLTLKPKVKNLKKKVLAAIKKRYKLKNVSMSGTRVNGTRIRGRGDYSIGNAISDAGNFANSFMPWNDDTPSQGKVNSVARSIGNTVGNVFGVGKQAGNAASWLSRAFGFGDYAIKQNSFTNGNIAQFSNHGTIEFAHREFIMDISSTTGFANSAYPINPGNATLFPWLSTLASNFEQYEMLGLIFEFKSTSATAVGSVNTGLGTVIMATDYDVLDTPYLDKRAMEVSEFSTSAAPFLSQIHPIECDPKMNVMKNLFIQPGNNISAYPGDKRFSAMGNFQIATSGMQAASVIGELWVSYHVRLYKPQLEFSETQSKTSLHQRLRCVAGAVPVLDTLITSNPGAISATYSVGRLILRCETAAGIGSCLIASCTISSSNAGSLATGPLVGSPYPTLAGATYLFNASDPLGAITRNCDYSNRASTDANGVIAGSLNNPTAAVYGVKFNAVGNTVSIAIWGHPTDTIYQDLYLAPYITPALAAPLDDGVSHRGEEYDSIMKMVRELALNQKKTEEEFTAMKRELEDETGEYEVSTPISEASNRPTPVTVYATHRKNTQAMLNSTAIIDRFGIAKINATTDK